MPSRIDDANCGEVRAALMLAVQSGATVIVADLTGTGSCGYSAAEALAGAQALVAATGARLKVAADTSTALLIGQIAGAGHQLDFYSDLESALRGPRRRDSSRDKSITGHTRWRGPGATARGGLGTRASRWPAAPSASQAPPSGPSPAPA